VTAYEALLADLAAEHAALAAVVEPLDDAALSTPTPAEGWDVADQLAHLAGFDEAATWALTEPDAFVADLEARLAEGRDPVAEYTDRGRAMAPTEVRTWWLDGFDALLDAARRTDPKARIPWYGPPMSSMSFLTARLMEAWAHGQDVRDALGLPPEVSDRLRHVAHIGVGARPFSYAVRGLDPPADPVDVVLRSPSGEVWRWGSGDADATVEGTALDFCLVVTQRRHVDDTDLVATGDAATKWIAIAQAFAGGVGTGRAPGQFDRTG
jgi:uncharacterized protein (TIGR03084 family)